jgi:hypothetical protein
MMGRRRRQGDETPQKNNLIEDLVGNNENEYPVPNHNKTMINELSDAHKTSLKEEINEDAFKKFQNTTNKKIKK